MMRISLSIYYNAALMPGGFEDDSDIRKWIFLLKFSYRNSSYIIEIEIIDKYDLF